MTQATDPPGPDDADRRSAPPLPDQRPEPDVSLPLIEVPRAQQHFARPPTDAEKYSYIRGFQHRWFFFAHTIAFIGLAFSLYGFANMRYWTLVFLAPLALYAGETLLGLRTSTYQRRVTLPDHQFLVETYRPDTYPSIDVYLPSCGEDPQLIENTFHHVSRLEWPGELRVYALDDKGDPTVRALAAHYGYTYLARPGSEFKKAGNLQHAFERSTGDLILILDADFAPRHDVLIEIAPYFSDHSTGIVQTPQHFATDSDMHWLTRCAGATQEMFYRFIQPSRDAVRAAICCGSSAMYSRRALDAIGGFPQISHSEDVFTGIEMDKRGYHLQYVPLNLTQGLSPDNINSFITQQYRWCEGSVSMASGADFHTSATLSRPQRLCYWAGFVYYLTTAVNVFFAPIPMLIMIWLFPEYVRPSNFLPLVGLFGLWVIVYPRLMRSSWRLDVLRVQVIYGFAHAVSIYDVFFGTTAEWVPTGSQSTPTPLAVKVRRLAVIYIALSFGGVLIGLAYRLGTDFSLAHWWAAITFLGVNLYIFLPVLWLCAGLSAPELRRPFRPQTFLPRRRSIEVSS